MKGSECSAATLCLIPNRHELKYTQIINSPHFIQ